MLKSANNKGTPTLSVKAWKSLTTNSRKTQITNNLSMGVIIC